MLRLIITTCQDYLLSVVCEEMKAKTIHVLSKDTILGNIYVGRVENVVHNISAAFIEYEKGKKAYYPLSDKDNAIVVNRQSPGKICQGDLLLVQVSRDALKTKEPALTGRLCISGRYCAVSLRQGKKRTASVFISKKITDEAVRSRLKALVQPLVTDDRFDIIVRTNAENAPEDAVENEVRSVVAKLQAVCTQAQYAAAFTRLYSADTEVLTDVKNIRASGVEKIITDIPSVYAQIQDYLNRFEPEENAKLTLYQDHMLPLQKLYNLEGQLMNALKKTVWLPSGGYLVIEPTEALTVIDVNSGKFSGKRKQMDNTFFKINMEACSEICRQMMLRNLSGIILVDFINLETKEEQKELLQHLEKLVKTDSVPTSVIDITKLGLVEITRKKIRKPLYEMVQGKDRFQKL